MTKKIALAWIILSLFSAPAFADTFNGTIYFTARSANCANFPRLATMGMRYLPRNLGTNGDTTILTLDSGLPGNSASPFIFMLSLRADSINLIGPTFRPINGNAIFEDHTAFLSQMRITTQTPTVPVTTTKSLKLAGNIRDFNGVADCDVAFEATGYKYP